MSFERYAQLAKYLVEALAVKLTLEFAGEGPSSGKICQTCHPPSHPYVSRKLCFDYPSDGAESLTNKKIPKLINFAGFHTHFWHFA